MHGDKLDYHRKQQVKRKPSPLDFRPVPDAETLLYLQAYTNIGHFRPPSMSSIAPVLLSDITAYFDQLFPIGTKTEFTQIMIALDKTYIKTKSN